MIKQILSIVLLAIVANASLIAQSSSWKREAEETVNKLSLFKSTETLNLPTAETLWKGDWFFHISHRFTLPISEGVGEVWGIDGSVIMRIAVGYAFTDDFMVTLGRSNAQGNIDLRLKHRVFQTDNNIFPTVVSVLAAGAYNGKIEQELDDESRLWQGYGFAVLNTNPLKSDLFLGVTPGFLYNANPTCNEMHNSWVLGMYAQYYFLDMWSFIVEAMPTLDGWRDGHDSYTFGVELETGGHFFKLSLGNSYYANMTQFMAGAENKFTNGDLHIGFQILRTF